jgi:ribosome-binding protein aMBF1 (putative translation factor)
MAIQPKCEMCGKELEDFGAILFSPPDEESKTLKLHLCVNCYKKVFKKFKYKPSSAHAKKVLK